MAKEMILSAYMIYGKDRERMSRHPSGRRKQRHERTKRLLSVMLMFCLLLQGVNISALSVGASQETSCYIQEHTHSDSCYDEEGNLICGLDEHTHGDECYATDQSDESGEVIIDEKTDSGDDSTDGGDEATEAENDFADSESESTDSAEEVEDIDVVITTDMKYAVANEDKIIFNVEATGGKAPLNKYFEIYCNQDLAIGESLNGDTITYMPQSCGIYTLRVSVTDALGSTVGTEYTIPVAVNEKEDSSEWEATLQDVTLTDDHAGNLADIAKTQIGYTESTRNFIINDNDEQKGYTRYGDWYGSAYEDWNTLFASFCLKYANVPDEYLVTAADSAAWMNEHPELYIDDEDGYTPKAGDLVFFHDSDDTENTDSNYPTRVGIIEAVDNENGKVTVIEGDVQDSVTEQSYSLSNESIVGYVEIPSDAEVADAENTEADEVEMSDSDAEDMIAVASDTDTVSGSNDETERAKIILTSEGQINKGVCSFKIQVSDWNGNAADKEKLTGVLEKSSGDSWTTVTTFSSKQKNECKWETKNQTFTLEELLNTTFRFRFTENNSTGEAYSPEVMSEEFYLADLIQPGFRKWVLDVYPDVYNEGALVKDLSDLQAAYDIYKNNKVALSIVAEDEENLLGNMAAFDISFSSSDDLNKDKPLQLYLNGDTGVDITNDAEVLVVSGSEYVSLGNVSNGAVTINLLQKLPKNTEIKLLYSFKVGEGSTLGDHSLYGSITNGDKSSGEDLGKYKITEPTSGWMLRSAELQTTGNITPKRDDASGKQVIYKLTLSNYGDSEVTAKKLEAEWSGGNLYSTLLNENNVIPAATVTKNADGTETKTPGTLELTCTFEAPASYESVENITFTVTDSIRESKEVISKLKLKQDGTYWLVTADGTVNINVDGDDNATFGTVSATVTDNLDETPNADYAINGKIQYWSESAGKWETVTSNLTSPTSGTFSQVNTGSDFTAVFDTTYLTVNDLLNIKYRFIANAANTKKKDQTITYNTTDDNAENINASQPFYLVDKLEKSGFRTWVLDPVNGYDTSRMTLDDLANAYKVYSRLGLNVDVSATQKEYEAGFDATFNVNVSSESALNMNSEIRIKLSDITDGLSVDAGNAINFQDNLSVVENVTDYAQEITVEGDEIVVRMGKSLPTGKALCLKVTSALTFATEIGAHTISAHATYKENGEIKLEDTDSGELNVLSPSGWHIVSVTGPAAAVYPGDEVAYTVKLQNFDDTAVTFTTNEIKALFGNDKSELKIVGYTDSTGAALSDTFTLNGGETKEIIVKMTSPTGSEATGTKNVQFSVTDTAKKTETKDVDMVFAKAEITIEPSVTYNSSTDEYTVKLVCKDLYGTEIPQHDLTWESKDTETTTEWKSIGTQNITATLGKDKKYTYVDNAEFVLTGENLAALEAKKDSSVILYRLKDAVSGTDYYSLPVYFDNLQDLKDAAKLMVELAEELGYSYEDFSTILDYLYYKEVAADDNVPFSDRSSLTLYLLKKYRDGGNDINEAVKVWYKYYTDMMDPNMQYRSTGHGSQALPTTKPQDYDWEDEDLQYDKDEDKTYSNPFHKIINGTIKGMKELLQEGGLYKGSYFSDLLKTATADKDGDENKERNYTIDIKANADGTVSVPTVVVFQVQTSWQMFDLQHANQVNGPKGACATVTDMATLYDIKHAMIDFAEYMKEYGDGSVCFAVTDVEHAGTFSMIASPYFTNDMKNLIEGLEQWDIFGNCEHVHYTSQAYEDAVAAITKANFEDWKDGNGNSIFENANKVAVVIGGSTENSSGKDGYGCVLPDMTGLDCLYTIRCNSGTAYPYLSWLDNTSMTNLVKKYNGIAFKDVTSREQLVSVFKAILQDIGKLGKIDAAKNVVLEDKIESEFELIKGSVKLVTYDFNGNPTETEIADDDDALKITSNDDGTTTIKYNAGTVAYGGTVHLKFKVHAKDNYIGSNNVKTNVDVPTLQYQNDIYGSGTAQMKFTDEPKVNVPVTYTIEDGGTKEVQVNTEVNLWNDLDAEKIVGKTGNETGIEDWASGSGNNYDQINGTVTYQWEKQKLDDDGNPVTDDNGNPVYETFGDPASVHVTNGKTDEDYPDLETKFTPTSAGEYKFRLKTVFTPDSKTDDWSGENDSQVSESVQYGYVTVTAKEQVKTASVKVIKNIDNYNKMSDGFDTTKFTVSVTKADGSSVVTKALTSQGYDSSDSNTAQGTVSIDDDTKLVFSELTQDDRALKFEFKALNITITDKDGNVTKTSYSADGYSLNGDGKLVDENGEVVQIAVKADDSVEAEFVNSFIASPIPTGILAGSYMKWLIAAVAVIAALGVTRYSFVIRKRRRGGR